MGVVADSRWRASVCASVPTTERERERESKLNEAGKTAVRCPSSLAIGCKRRSKPTQGAKLMNG